jgi:beta-glucosidase-like glycosyl hydrolase/CubicO group peptidase (beta-lactamase class C family)
LKIKTIILAGTFLFLTEIFGQGVAIKTWRGFPSSPNKEWAKWADSVLKTLPLRKQIGQMMMVAVWSNKGAEHINETEKLIYDYGIGGLCFFQGHPLKQAYQTNYYQQISSLPLLVSIDAEWGLNMRLKTLPKFPYQMTLGATGDEDLIYKTGKAMGMQCKRLGIHINFAPVVDINTNPANPIIGFRSFGESPEKVSRYASLMEEGLQSTGVIACAKHFPGHGDSETDSHKELPTISAGNGRLDSVELLPFKTLIEKNVGSIMTGHLAVPALDSSANTPASLSKPIVTGLLKEKLGYDGLVITDALNMKGVSSLYGPGYAEAKAALAGNDILLFPENVPLAVDLIENMVRNGEIDSAELSRRVFKILFYKALAGLQTYKPIATENLMKDLNAIWKANNPEPAAEKAIAVCKDDYGFLPLLPHTKIKTAWIGIGKNNIYPFETALRSEHIISAYLLHRDSNAGYFNRMLDSILCHNDRIIISLHDQPLWGKERNTLPKDVVTFITSALKAKPGALVVFGSPNLLQNLQDIPCSVVAYEDGSNYQYMAARILFGANSSRGNLPVSVPPALKAGAGLKVNSHWSEYLSDSPLNNGFSSDFTRKMDSLLGYYSRQKAMPGGQLLVLKNGKSVYNQAYGHFEYNGTKTVSSSDLYDLASVTKVAASTLCIMKLYETKQIKLDAHLHAYLPELKKTNKSKLTIRQLMTHGSGLQAFIPFYKEALSSPGLFSKTFDSAHAIQVCDSMWMRQTYTDTLWQKIIASDLKNKGQFVYSDLGFIILGKIVERVSGMSVAKFAQLHFYDPMRLKRTLFQPSERFFKSEIAPTTEDNYFRQQRIQGFVHDPTAAILGGVAGHAGLFSNATELGKIMQMLNNGGQLEGKRYLKPSTVALFTAAQKGTHRGLGFDKPNGQPGAKANISDKVPGSMFGHSGFTGNWAWADPGNQLVFVFLSNRTYPDEQNKKLIQENVRTKALELVYSALRP